MTTDARSTDLATVATTQLKASIAATSLQSLMRSKTQRSLLLVDTSGSMNDRTLAGLRKIDALRQVVKDLREAHSVPVAAFDGKDVRIVDTVPEPGGTTNMDEAIDFGRIQGATHLIIVTDGQPDSEHRTFNAARAFGQPIDVFYIGDGNDSGAQFAQALAKATGGTANVTDLGVPKQLTSAIIGLLGTGA